MPLYYRYFLYAWFASVVMQALGLIITAITPNVTQDFATPFAISALVLPALYLIISRSFRFTAIATVLFGISTLLFMHLCWDYADKSWFSPPESNNCDGPCYGWFSFERDMPIWQIIIAIGISLIIGGVVLVSRKILKQVFYKKK